MQAARSKIAVVDDDNAVRESLSFLLTIAGHQVMDFGSAEEFLQCGALDQVLGLILDHHMPRISGLELAARLRGGGWPFPILLITGVPSPAIVARAAELGIEQVLEKPPAEPDIMAFIDGLGG
jgi:two-component system, LuxR family, response regulator FixJ